MHVSFVTAAWQRFEVTRLALAQRAHLLGELAAKGIDTSVVIVADDDNLDIAREYGFDTVEQTNDQLGRKFNDGIQHACEHGADFVAVVGSDDWVHPDLFDDWPLDANQPDVLTGREMAVVDLRRGVLRRCRVRGRYGAIPWVLSRKALEPSRFRPINDKVNRGVDGSLMAGLRVSPNWVYRDPHDLCRVDFKTDLNLTPYNATVRVLGYGDETDLDVLSERYPANLVEMAKSLVAV